jgi:hypothetical protein
VLALTVGLLLQSPSDSPNGTGSESSLLAENGYEVRPTVSPAVQNQINSAPQAAMLAQAESSELKALDD